MNRQLISARQGVCRAGFAAALAAACSTALAAPVITEVMSGAPPHAQAGATIGVFGHGFTPPVQAFFSDGANPTVAASPVAADPARGFLIFRLPAGAATGNLKIAANGVDSNLFYFRRDAGTFSRGTSVVTGQVFAPNLAPVQGALVLLLSEQDCDGDMVFWDHAVTDATGAYTVQGQPADYMLFVFPPLASNLTVSSLPVTAPTVQPVPLSTGTTVNGRVVLASAPSTGVANARMEFEGDGFDTMLTNASGYYSVVLPPASYEMQVMPPPSAVLARSPHIALNVGASSPLTASDVALSGGVRIHGTVRRQTDSTPMPGMRVSAWPNSPGASEGSDTYSAGDGTYAAVVPPNASYQVSTRVEGNEPYAQAQVDSVVVASSDVLQNFSLLDAGFLRGTVTDASTSSPLAEMQVHVYPAPWGNNSPIDSAQTCADGTYTLRVPPSLTGYIVTSGYGDDSGYVPAAYLSPSGTTFFPCEGSAVTVASVGASVTDIDFPLHNGAGVIEGSIRTESSGCTSDYDEFLWVQVDNGAEHGCGLGFQDWTMPAGSYRTLGVPHASLLPVLRACVFPPGAGSSLCYDSRTYPQFTSIPVPSGGSQSGVDFCIGDQLQPTLAVGPVQTAKSAGQFTLSWSATGDPAAASYRVRGATSARPSTAPGSFPGDPNFVPVWNGPGTSATLPVSTPSVFFLVTPVGPTGIEGPSGHYPNAP